MIQSFVSAKKDKVTRINQISKIEREMDKCKVTLTFRDRNPMFFTFQDPAFRERFLGRVTGLWKLELQDMGLIPPQDLRGMSLSSREELDTVGLESQRARS